MQASYGIVSAPKQAELVNDAIVDFIDFHQGCFGGFERPYPDSRPAIAEITRYKTFGSQMDVLWMGKGRKGHVSFQAVFWALKKKNGSYRQL